MRAISDSSAGTASIEAHLTIVFAAWPVSCRIEE